MSDGGPYIEILAFFLGVISKSLIDNRTLRREALEPAIREYEEYIFYICNKWRPEQTKNMCEITKLRKEMYSIKDDKDKKDRIIDLIVDLQNKFDENLSEIKYNILQKIENIKATCKKINETYLIDYVDKVNNDLKEAIDRYAVFVNDHEIYNDLLNRIKNNPLTENLKREYKDSIETISINFKASNKKFDDLRTGNENLKRMYKEYYRLTSKIKLSDVCFLSCR